MSLSQGQSYYIRVETLSKCLVESVHVVTLRFDINDNIIYFIYIFYSKTNIILKAAEAGL